MELRGYFFVNMYLSGKQGGIQAFHCLGDMVTKYNGSNLAGKDKLFDYLTTDKTLILLNGGSSDYLFDIYRKLSYHSDELEIPVGYFNEPSLGGTLTCVGTVLPKLDFTVDDDIHSMSPEELGIVTKYSDVISMVQTSKLF